MRGVIKSLIFLSFVTTSNFSWCQDTIRLKTEPKVKLHGWYPEYQYVDELKIGDGKIIITLTPDFDSTRLRNCIIDLKTTNKDILIEETSKKYPSQFFIEVNQTKAKSARIEAWLLLENFTVLIYRKNKWVNIKDIYPVEGDSVRIDTIKLKIRK